MRCCHLPCGVRPVDFPVNISNKLLLDIRRHVRKYYAVSIRARRPTRPGKVFESSPSAEMQNVFVHGSAAMAAQEQTPQNNSLSQGGFFFL